MDFRGIHKVEEEVRSPFPYKILHYSIASNGDIDRTKETSPLSMPIGKFSFDELLDMVHGDDEDRQAFADHRSIAIQCGGWQSWSAAWELMGSEGLPKKVLAVPELIKYTNRDGDTPKTGELVGHFIMYLRVGRRYLCIASREGAALPPLTFRTERKPGVVHMEVYDRGKLWSEGDEVAEVYVFLAKEYFALKDMLRKLYNCEESFDSLAFLRKDGEKIGGFESWYNHYTDINEGLILEDLEALGTTDNIMNLYFIQRSQPVVFQIDDGWERAVGDWEIDTTRFPHGLKTIAHQIESKGYIPGLWMAPFLVTRKARIFLEKNDWLLKDHDGQPVVAGFNDKWDNQFYCLDLSRSDVRDYLRNLIDRAIDEWGFRYLKLDFLYAGLLSGAFAMGGAAFDHYESACHILTSRKQTEAGDPVVYLGCGVPFGPSYRHFPLSRIGADTRESWDWLKVKLIRHVGRPSAYINLKDTIGRSYMDTTVFINDPDVVFLRSKNCSLCEREKELIALVNFLLAGQLMFSDDPGQLEPEDIDFTSRIVNLYDQLSGDEYGTEQLDRDVYHLFSRSGVVAGLINLRRKPYALDIHSCVELNTAISTGEPIIDHRKSKGKVSLFQGHSISLFQI